MGALLWEHVGTVTYDDEDQLRPFAELLAAWQRDELSDAPTDRKLGVYVPHQLKRQLKGVAKGLGEKRLAADPSTKTLLSALIWRYVHVRGETVNDDLVELLKAYRAELRPRPVVAFDRPDDAVAVRIVP